MLKKNPNIGLSELYGKLRRDYAYNRHPASLFRFLRKMGIYTVKEAEHNKYKPKPYHTPVNVGIKCSWMSNAFQKSVISVRIIKSSINKRSNDIPSSSIVWLSPLEKRESLIDIKHNSKKILPIFSKNLFNELSVI